MKLFGVNAISLLVLFVLMASSDAYAQNPDESRPESGTTEPISGRVIDEAGQQIANAVVTVRSISAPGNSVNVTTDAEGKFKTSSLSSGSYTVSARVPGLITERRDLNLMANPYHRPGDSVTITMMKGGVITGTVIRPNGEPMVAGLVRAHMVRDAAGQKLRYGSPQFERMTDDRGVYRIYGLSPGTYLVSAGGRSPSRSQPTSFDMDQQTYFPSGSRETAVEVTVHGGQEFTADIRHREEPGYIISGTIAGQPTNSAFGSTNVTLMRLINNQPDVTMISFQNFVGFEFSGISDGTYELYAQTFSPTGEATFAEPHRVTIKGRDVTGISLVTRPFSSIRGHIVLSPETAAACQGKQRPVMAETLVTVRGDEQPSNPDEPRSYIGLGSQTAVDAKGDFHLRNLRPNEYTFSVTTFARYWYLKSVSLSATPNLERRKALAAATRNTIPLKLGENLRGVAITLAEGAASLRGRVVGNTAKEGHRAIYLTPLEPESVDNELRYYATSIQADRTFRFSNVAPGRYWIISRESNEHDLFTLTTYRNAGMADARKKLRNDAERANKSVEFKPCQNVTDYDLMLSATSDSASASKN